MLSPGAVFVAPVAPAVQATLADAVAMHFVFFRAVQRVVAPGGVVSNVTLRYMGAMHKLGWCNVTM
jgi:hypothetical protein